MVAVVEALAEAGLEWAGRILALSPAQRALFAAVELGEGALRRVRGSSLWSPEDPERFLTALFRLPAPVTEPLLAAVAPLREAGQHVYPPGTVHLTALCLDPWANRFDETGAAVVARAADALRTAAPVRVRFHGLGLARQSLFARAYSPDGSLLRLRRDLARALGPRRHGARGHAAALGLFPVGFVNLVRFTAPAGAAVHACVRAARELAVGPLRLSDLELVHCDRVLSAERSSVRTRVALAG